MTTAKEKTEPTVGSAVLTTYHVNMTFTENVLASSPADPEVYRTFIAKKEQELKDGKMVPSDKPVEALAEEETSTLPADREQTGWSVFHQDETGLFLFDYHIRGFLKEAAGALTGKGLTAYRSKIDKWVFVNPRRIYFMRDGNPIKEKEVVCERPIRAMTMQGPRVSLKRSDSILSGATLACEVVILPLGAKEITKEHLDLWFKYGQFSGLGEWRTGGNGRFTATVSDPVKQ